MGAHSISVLGYSESVASTLITKSGSTTPHKAATCSTVARKILMSLTGLCLILFLLMHVFGNLKLLVPDSGAEFDEYSHALRTFLYPILPEKFFLWCFRLFLLACAVIHILFAVQLTFRNFTGGNRVKYLKTRYLEGSFAARTMIWSGIIIFLAFIFHLLQFTTQTIRINYPAGEMNIAPHLRVVNAFQQPWMVIFYAIFVGLVCFHIWHGFSSAFTTLGLRLGATSSKVIHACAWIVALALFVGFMLTPILIATGVIFS
uniref:succinate dehydrogenase cytochrome b subunit n=1 Tax=Vaginimicrobium propionicum TaxID=1871034 RepID=UPI0009FB3912|nr:succinate dehydrogenase cytochrome b subunit [Vaginimicrobium propionicum]